MQEINNTQKKLLQLIKEIIERPGNITFKKEVEKTLFNDKANTSSYQNTAIINAYAYKAYLAQAHEYYKKLKVDNPSLKPQLIEDYVQMMHFFHTGNYERFALACYQQIESIINFSFSTSDIRLAIRKQFDKIVCTNKYKDTTLGDLLFHNVEKPDVSQRVFFTKENTWSARIKIKVTLHYFILNHNQTLDLNFKQIGVFNYFFRNTNPYKFYEFKEAYDKINYIYIARNLIHRNPVEYNSAYEKSFSQKVEKELKESPLKAAIKILQYFNDFVFKYIECTINRYHFNIQFASSISYWTSMIKYYLKDSIPPNLEEYLLEIKSHMNKVKKNPAVDAPISIEMKETLDKLLEII